MDDVVSKIRQLQKAFAELESHRAVTLTMKWKDLEEHFHGLERSLKRRFHELEDQEKEFQSKTTKARELIAKREAEVSEKENASLQLLQQHRDAALLSISKPTVDEPSNVSNPESEQSKTVTYPELVSICGEMDPDKLHKFISDNRKNLAVVRDEIVFALKAAADAPLLVLNSLKDFYSSDHGKKDSVLLGIRRTCIMLMECLTTFIDSSGSGVSDEIKDQAKSIANQWEPELGTLDVEGSSGNSLEAHAFLQLLATFGIAGDFDEKIVCGLIPMVSRRRQAADLCRSLGLSDKMPGVVEVLINSGRHIDAVNLSFAFGLTESFPPTALLKSYLKESRKGPSPGKQTEMAGERELGALKAVVRCVEEHKLEEEFPLEPLQKRVSQLEKAKEDKKRATETVKPQTKRPRANCAPRAGNLNERSFYPRYSQYGYERQYGYPVQPNFAPNYFANGYQYPSPYLH